MARADILKFAPPEKSLPEDLLTLSAVSATLRDLASPDRPFFGEAPADTIAVVNTVGRNPIKGIRLSSAVAKQSGLGRRVHADVVGDHDAGIAVILKPARPFSSRRHGFLLKPIETPEDLLLEQAPHDFTVHHGEASAPTAEATGPAMLLGMRSCQALFDERDIAPCTPDIAAEFLLSLRERLNRFDD